MVPVLVPEMSEPLKESEVTLAPLEPVALYSSDWPAPTAEMPEAPAPVEPGEDVDWELVVCAGAVAANRSPRARAGRAAAFEAGSLRGGAVLRRCTALL